MALAFLGSCEEHKRLGFFCSKRVVLLVGKKAFFRPRDLRTILRVKFAKKLVLGCDDQEAAMALLAPPKRKATMGH